MPLVPRRRCTQQDRCTKAALQRCLAVVPKITSTTTVPFRPGFYICMQGFDPVFGARPVKRAVQQQLETTIAKALLRGEFGEEDVVRHFAIFA